MPVGSIATLPSHTIDKHTDVARHIFLPPRSGYFSQDGSFSKWGGARCRGTASDTVNFNWKVPDDFVSLTSVHILTVCPTGEGEISWNASAEYGQNGEDYNQHDATLGATKTTLTQNKITRLSDISSILANLASGDYVGISFTRLGAADTLNEDTYVLGLLILYTGEQ